MNKHKMFIDDGHLYCAAHGEVAKGDPEYLARVVVVHIRDGHAYQPTTVDEAWAEAEARHTSGPEIGS